MTKTMFPYLKDKKWARKRCNKLYKTYKKDLEMVGMKVTEEDGI